MAKLKPRKLIIMGSPRGAVATNLTSVPSIKPNANNLLANLSSPQTEWMSALSPGFKS